jgi:hypothetical protein
MAMSKSATSMTRRKALGTLALTALGSRASAKEADTRLVWGIAELFEWVLQRRQSTGHDTADCLQAHLDHGIRRIIWHLGRSTLDYHSELPTSTRYSGDTRPESKLIAESFRKECSLRAALAFAAKNDMVIYGRLAMNRHYGPGYGGGLRSKFVANHPEWLERDRKGNVDQTRVSFGVPEYREERIGILLEAAQFGAHGLTLDFCRQPPLVRYHPMVLDGWLEAGRPDPRRMRVGTPEFMEWARNRCECINIFLQILRVRLRQFEEKSGRKVPVMARIPEATLDLNLMEGIDVATWVKEGFVDEVALDPFVLWDFEYPHSANAYVDLCRAHGVKIYGGANCTAAKGTVPNGRGFLERVARNYEEGADGIALYQTDTPLHDARLKPILTPLLLRLGDAAAVDNLLSAARRSQPELTEKARWFSVDNHSKLRQFGHEPGKLETI